MNFYDTSVDFVRLLHQQVVGLRAAWPDQPTSIDDEPSEADLRQLLETAAQASLGANEGRATRVRIALATARTLSEVLVFGAPVDFDAAQVVKLSPAVPVDGCLAICPLEGRLRIWGIGRSSPRFGSALTVEITDPGTVRVNAGSHLPFAVITGREVVVLGSPPNRLADYLYKILYQGATSDDPLENRARFPDCLAVADVARLVLDEGHGGTLLIVPDVEHVTPATIESMYRLDPPDATIHELTRARERWRDQATELAERIARREIHVPPERVAMVEYYARALWSQRERVRFVADLAGVDGALVLTRDMHIVGFGAKIGAAAPGAVTHVYECEDEQRPSTTAIPLEDTGGTRHQSACRFVYQQRAGVAIVVSQDRHMKCLHWDERRGGVAFVRNTEWWA